MPSSRADPAESWVPGSRKPSRWLAALLRHRPPQPIYREVLFRSNTGVTFQLSQSSLARLMAGQAATDIGQQALGCEATKRLPVLTTWRLMQQASK